ncbi:cytochrome ubiquinol oxidase subunit I [Enemella evansiae]|uniref:cytochrome ubiquinol oxidase subunit I n=1 Tax=Enemella evansiae TaxID=2016499 RepID=UPI000B96FFE4|nr:cytochrome ubiquinol oxidase subunit I [Enemella evansiae]OYN99592.1 cytochrome ubiquinol oxidase subunit I [Enemella evansiae]PFG65411.1 cytochrome d ubiquinol oxidase subunit I [Propionibacteriaceae bacterium ES.041]
MSTETLARWQFGITTVYHFLFVPITLAMSFLVAIFQTMWVRTGNNAYLRLTKFYGKLFLINFAMGVVTGIVQEFQFGMNWSDYSRFVGDIFGAPLALEALLAFFLESTFLGLWIFGWDRLPKKIHLATIWIAAIGTNISAIFILAANSWMQNPVGWRFNELTNRAELTDFGAVLLNPVLLVTLPHQLAAAWMVSGALVAAIGGWHLYRLGRGDGNHEQREEKTHRTAVRIGAVAMLIGSLGVLISGDLQGKVMTEVQPMKMAAAEALYETEQPADFSLLTIGTLDGQHEVWSIKIPRLLSFLAHSNFTGEVQGINPLNRQYQAEFQPQLQQVYGPEIANRITTYNPNIPLTYWTFRIMMGLGFLAMGIGVLTLWLTRGNRLPRSRIWFAMMVTFPLAPLFANSFGWIFTETGRQPWVVFGVMPTAAGVSPGVTPGMVLFSMITFTLVYGVLAVIEVGLFLKYIRMGLPEVEEPKVLEDEDSPMSFAY